MLMAAQPFQPFQLLSQLFLQQRLLLLPRPHVTTMTEAQAHRQAEAQRLILIYGATMPPRKIFPEPEAEHIPSLLRTIRVVLLRILLSLIIPFLQWRYPSALLRWIRFLNTMSLSGIKLLTQLQILSSFTAIQQITLTG